VTQQISYLGARHAWHNLRLLAKPGRIAMIDKTQLVNALYVSRRSKRTRPEGQFDEFGFWFPSQRESQGDVRNIKPPSDSWPHSYLIHCRSRRHCAVLVDAAISGRDVPDDALEVVTKPTAAVQHESTPRQKKPSNLEHAIASAVRREILRWEAENKT